MFRVERNFIYESIQKLEQDTGPSLGSKQHKKSFTNDVQHLGEIRSVQSCETLHIKKKCLTEGGGLKNPIFWWTPFMNELFLNLPSQTALKTKFKNWVHLLPFLATLLSLIIVQPLGFELRFDRLYVIISKYQYTYLFYRPVISPQHAYNLQKILIKLTMVNIF